MGRRKNSNNNNQGSMGFNNAQHQGTKIRFQGEDEELTTESSNLDESTVTGDKAIAMDDDSMCEPDVSFVDGDDDKTSADYYFDSYSHFGIHEEMLKDMVRTKTYQNVIYQNKFLFKNKVVLDVGAGTGILSLFCAKAGAARVYAVECSDMADMAKEIVESNGFSENKASLYLTAIEDADYKEDKIEFPFKLVADRDDYIHALVAYFDVSFTNCHKLMGFSTGPRSRATHWKQTVLYLEDVLTICEGEVLTGNMTVAPNKKNPRDIDIMIKYALNGRAVWSQELNIIRCGEVIYMLSKIRRIGGKD
ncbi:hypothetical protein GH714_038877 [Hevea brasiliensis]|uniref:Protein arginine N-methyltransferase domain-containing protein n=1 Tax=Hevea brasiliensis TaxID=3981 RepID=A0A6A6K8Q0_HEVBR|nr:hypothetical protein GH714_038877 [Hevea brasiliensis]